MSGTVKEVKIRELSGELVDAGRVQLLAPLAAGGYGTIYSAQDLDNNKTYAVKVMPRGAYKSLLELYQLREITHHRVMSSHPNVITLHRTFADEKHVYLMLDFCPAGDLFQVITDRRAFGGNDTLTKRVFLQVLDAVQSCHDNGIYHRDLKPDNILVNKDLSQVYLADFGLATKTRESRNFGVGSDSYMSPDCINQKRRRTFYNTRRSDIWALGVILINILTGRSPWVLASLRDESYRAFMCNPEGVLQTLPISKGARQILRGIFAENSSRCLEISRIKEMVEALDTFYMTSTQLSRAHYHARSAAQDYFVKKTLSGKIDLGDVGDDELEESSTMTVVAISEISEISEPTLPESLRNCKQIAGSPFMTHWEKLFPKTTNLTSSNSSSSPSSRSSSSESEGPATPETFAQSGAVECIPKLDLGELQVLPCMEKKGSSQILRRIMVSIGIVQ